MHKKTIYSNSIIKMLQLAILLNKYNWLLQLFITVITLLKDSLYGTSKNWISRCRNLNYSALF